MLVDLEWGDDKNNTNDEHEAEDDENLKIASEGNEAVGDENHAAENIVPNSVNTERFEVREKRVKQTPSWMKDYDSSKGLSKEEIELNIALIAFTDLINYKEAVKSSKWRSTIDSEIHSIEKN